MLVDIWVFNEFFNQLCPLFLSLNAQPIFFFSYRSKYGRGKGMSNINEDEKEKQRMKHLEHQVNVMRMEYFVGSYLPFCIFACCHLCLSNNWFELWPNSFLVTKKVNTLQLATCIDAIYINKIDLGGWLILRKRIFFVSTSLRRKRGF